MNSYKDSIKFNLSEQESDIPYDRSNLASGDEMVSEISNPVGKEKRALVGVKPTAAGQARGFYYGDFADEVKSKDYDKVYQESGTSENLREL